MSWCGVSRVRVSLEMVRALVMTDELAALDELMWCGVRVRVSLEMVRALVMTDELAALDELV